VAHFSTDCFVNLLQYANVAVIEEQSGANYIGPDSKSATHKCCCL